MAISITKENFDELVLGAALPVLVDFSATWCGPCKMLAPVVEELAQEVAGKANVYKIDIDEQPELAEKFGVMSVPTVLVFEGGQVKEQSIGFVPKAKLLSLLAL